MSEKDEQFWENESEQSADNPERPTASPMERALSEIEMLMNDTTESEEETQPPHGIYIDDMGREHSADEIQAQGSFYTKPEVKKVAEYCIRLSLPTIAASFIVIYIMTLFIQGDIQIPVFVITAVQLGVLIVPELIVLYHCITSTPGILHRYKADGRAFYVTVMGKDKVIGDEKITGKEQILYKDVLGVSYTPTTLLLGDRGYNVDIITTYGVIHYDYIFPRFKHSIAAKDLPFEVIKRNIPNRDDVKKTPPQAPK